MEVMTAAATASILMQGKHKVKLGKRSTLMSTSPAQRIRILQPQPQRKHSGNQCSKVGGSLNLVRNFVPVI